MNLYHKIAILLPTYNSEKYFKEQVESIINQTYEDWILYIRDDGSNDGTINLISQYTKQYPQKIKYVDSKNKHLGACQSFFQLLKTVEHEYYMFSDHDDVWLPNKIEITIEQMIRIENHFSKCPVIVHTDMYVVNENLSEIHSSFWKYSRLLPKYNKFYDLMVCNNINGCTMMINNRAKTVSTENSHLALMHDVWISLCVANKNGKISFLNAKTVMYRQHMNNVIGANDVNLGYFVRKFSNIHLIIKANLISYRNANKIKDVSILCYIFYKIKIITMRVINTKPNTTL